MRQVYVADSAVVGVVKFTAALVERDESKYAADGVLVAVMFGGDQIERDGIGHDSSDHGSSSGSNSSNIIVQKYRRLPPPPA